MNTIQALTEYFTEECSKVDLQTRYDEMLDDCYSLSSVGGPFACMSASSVLKEVDPTAYRCGMNDYEDSDGLVEIEGDYYERYDVDKAVEAFIDGLESDTLDLEDEIREEQAHEEPDTDLISELETQISAKQAEIAAAKAHSF